VPAPDAEEPSYECCNGHACYGGDGFSRSCGIYTLNTSTRICCGGGAQFVKDGKKWCCPPAHNYVNGQCVRNW
jgi:hypothetical protein